MNADPLAVCSQAIRYTLSPVASFAETMFRPSFFLSAPANVPRTVCALCRHRHKAHYADAQIMPTYVGKPFCVAGIAAMESA